MPRPVRPRVLCFVLLIVLMQLVHTEATRTQAAPSIRDFFLDLVEHYDPATAAKGNDLLKVADQIADARPEDISQALPAIRSALKHREDLVKIDGAYILMVISFRRDSTELLKGSVSDIGALLDQPNSRLQSMAVGIFAYLKPEPPTEATPFLVAFVKRADRDPIAQASAFSVLLRIAPDNPAVIPALDQFMSRPLDEQSKDALINAIANSHTENVVAADVLVKGLEDPSEGVRFQAAQAFQRMPHDMVMRAKPALQRLIGRTDESQEVKNAAKEALRIVENQN